MENLEGAVAQQDSPQVPVTPRKLDAVRRLFSKNKSIFLAISSALVLTLVLALWIFRSQRPVEGPEETPLPIPRPVEISEEFLKKEGPPEVKVLSALFSKIVLPAFAEFGEEETRVTPALPAYTLTVADLINLKDIEEQEFPVRPQMEISFSSAQLGALGSRGFFVRPLEGQPGDPAMVVKPDQRVDDMIDTYRWYFSGNWNKYYRKPEDAVFISTDFLLHIYHLFIDKTFQNIEEVRWHPILKKLSQGLFEDSLSRYQSAADPEEKESFKRLSVYFLVPAVILEASEPKPLDFSYPKRDEVEDYHRRDEDADSSENLVRKLSQYQDEVPSEVYDLAKAELDLIAEAKGMSPSPLFNALKSVGGEFTPEDYSQYKPRSHYTKNSLLRTYFRAMMWYGRHGFDVKSLGLTRDSVHMTWALNSLEIDGQRAIDLWEAIYLPTVFFVGRSDDLTFYDYSLLMRKIYGDGVKSEDLAAKLTQFQEEAQKLEGPKILSEAKLYSTMGEVPTKEELLASTKGFRFMGQRFIPDSYMFTKLTQGDEPPDPETGQRLPSTPTALMIMSILGSDIADTLLDGWIVTDAPDSDRVIAREKTALKVEFGKITEEEWTQNIYWSWLYTLKSLFEDFGEGYPMFMRGVAWAKKGLQAALGSWTELRHDTLLYAKQSYAEGGGGGPQPELPPVPKGYVEPNLQFFNRLLALSKTTRDGLKMRGLLIERQEERLAGFIEALEFLRSLVVKELSNQEISDDEYERLRIISKKELAEVAYPPTYPGEDVTEKEARAAIIADVHTDVPKGQVLYEATGYPSIIYVAVKDKGGARLTRGMVYSYYEFTEPLTERISDEEWQARIYERQGELPAPPSWTQDLVRE